MPTKDRRYYVESSIFCSVFTKESIEAQPGVARWQVGQDLLERARRGEIEIVTSAITVVEVNGGTSAPQQVIDLITSYFESVDMTIVELDELIAKEAREIVWQLRRAGMATNNFDCIHLASALRHECRALYTWDSKHLLAIGDKFDITIEQPRLSGQIRMDISD